jgi:hypothetical protein
LYTYPITRLAKEIETYTIKEVLQINEYNTNFNESHQTSKVKTVTPSTTKENGPRLHVVAKK